ncbi:methyltransferase domain-containing protein [Archangium violaceum]|uniref:methyltransferase n=1 Tax=Archangium violaceum TaxID=83451 RepID=UPI00194F2AD0|nr:methyltransferase [Archangium violaceum]QRO01229.1 methyltransferase domain-containing protein [Archangium violaceum]
MTHSHPPHVHIVPGFGADRAAHYDAQAAISLPGAQALYEVGVSALASQLDGQDAASLLFVGMGTGAELMPYLRFDVPGWRFTGVDPSDAMLAVARKRLEAEGLLSRTHLHVGELHTLPPRPPFDGAQMMGVLHHVQGHEARLELLREVARRLKPGAPFVVGCRIGKDPVLTNVEFRRWRAYGTPPDELERRRQAFSTLQPVESDAALFAMLAQAGMVAPRPIFVSLQFKVFLARYEPEAVPPSR